MKTCLALRHVAFEDLGSFEPFLADRGYAVRYADTGWDDLAGIDPLAPDLLVVLGGPIAVYDEACYPFLVDELRLIEARLAAGRPIVGLCLGAQLIARALGARVHANPAGKEIGWSPLRLTAAGAASALAGLGESPVLHWHGDIFELPEGATLLASTAITPHQAFSWGAALALQFHIEATGRGMERWFIGHCSELGQAGLSVPALRADSARFAPALEQAGPACLAHFLDSF